MYEIIHNQNVAVITGSSSGIGLETSLALARNGFLTYATARSLKKGARINTLATDKEKLLSKLYNSMLLITSQSIMQYKL